MNLERVDQIAKAVLYEGYMLYPYRPSSVKNRQRFNFGVVYPESYSQAKGGDDPCSLRMECLVSGNGSTTLEVRLRFLHLRMRPVQRPSSSSVPREGWQEAEECQVIVPPFTLDKVRHQPQVQIFEFRSGDSGHDGDIRRETVTGTIEISVEMLRNDLYKIRVHVSNTTLMETTLSRDEALMHSLVSTHIVLGVEAGEFVSLLEPPDGREEYVGRCQNAGVWPVLVGDRPARDTLLASPIILYDYPQIAPESAGDLFDGTEIDEILSLRILTLTDDEKREIRESDERARLILDRTESMPAEQFMKLHGAVRGMRPLKEDCP